MRYLVPAIVLLTLACGPGSNVSTGRDLYMAYGCAACHGVRGDGNGPAAGLAHTKPRDLRNLKGYSGGSSIEGIASTIAFGVAEGRTGMPAYPDIPKQERLSMARYIHSLAAEPGEIRVSDAWAGESNPAWKIGAAYLTLSNTTTRESALTGVTANVPGTVEMHVTTSEDGMMSMRKVERIEIPQGSTVRLQPGGAHLMLLDLERDLRDGDTIELTLAFDDGSTRRVTAPVRRIAEQPASKGSAPASATATGFAGADFTLVDHDGRPFRTSSLRGRPALLFFGYTHCPDACPTVLSTISRAYRKAGGDGRKIPTLFVSVDPRDTPAVLKQYLGYFAAVPAKGLTGSKRQVDDVVGAFGARYEIRDSGSAAGPLVDHTLYVYLLDSEGNIARRFEPRADPEEIAAAMRRLR